MVYLRKLRAYRFLASTIQNPIRHPILLELTHLVSQKSYQSMISSSRFCKFFTISTLFEHRTDKDSNVSNDSDTEGPKKRKPLEVFFKEAVGLLDKSESAENDTESGSEDGELKGKLRRLEEEVRSLDDEARKNEAGPQKLSAFFNKEVKSDNKKSEQTTGLIMDDSGVSKPLSPDMVEFLNYLYKEGYFNHANFMRTRGFDLAFFESSYARNFIRCAAESFGKDKQEIAKWLSAGDLKKIALFGCPSLSKKVIFSAKRLRTFFKIQEDLVCSKCLLRESCKFVNQSVWKGDMKNLNLEVVMRVITPYALQAVPSQLVVSEEVKTSVSRLLKDVVRLSKTVS